MHIRHLVSVVLSLTLLGSCQLSGVEPLPIVGDTPEVIAIWPLATGGEPPDADLWFTGLAVALGRRGYRVLPPAITAQLLRSSDIAENASDDAAIGPALRADAVLRLDVRQFEAAGSFGLQDAEWDLEWRLVSTRGFGQQWSYVHRGYYRQADHQSFDPGRSLDEQYRPRDIVPIGGNRVPSFRNVGDLLLQLNNTAMAHLPMQLVPRQ